MSEWLIPIVALALVAGIVLAIRRVAKRSQSLKLLGERGHSVVGTVTHVRAERRSRGEKDLVVRYSFKSGGGTEYSHQLKVTPKEFKSYSEGQDIDIVYLPDDPNVNALKVLVDQITNAMNRKRQSFQ